MPTTTNTTTLPVKTTVFIVTWLAFGAYLGIKFADIDLKLSLLPKWLMMHRSLLTHGMLIPLILGVISHRKRSYYWMRAFTVGFAATSAVHLCFDLFPRAWKGVARIHIPILDIHLPGIYSWIWIAGSIIACLYVACFLLESIWEMLLAGGWIVHGIQVHSAYESPYFPLITLVICLIIVFALPLVNIPLFQKDSYKKATI